MVEMVVVGDVFLLLVNNLIRVKNQSIATVHIE